MIESNGHRISEFTNQKTYLLLMFSLSNEAVLTKHPSCWSSFLLDKAFLLSYLFVPVLSKTKQLIFLGYFQQTLTCVPFGSRRRLCSSSPSLDPSCNALGLFCRAQDVNVINELTVFAVGL